ncbi:MAG: hypothetical protein IPO42_02805 [Chitinophagaceae bacterium]|nr:hypothetical protein [Chitinophagaceae bacterium]
MKPFLISFLLIQAYISHSQISAFIKDSSIKELSIKEFKKESLLKLADTSLKVVSYVAYFTCDMDFHDPKETLCQYVSQVTVKSNSLYDNNFRKVLRKYKKYFFIVFDNVKYVNKNGDIELVEKPPKLKISK